MPCCASLVNSLPACVGARPRGCERRARGRARAAQRRDQHACVAAHRAGQRARAPSTRGGPGCLFRGTALFFRSGACLTSVCVLDVNQAQRGLHELYTTVADINAQEEGLPPAVKAKEPAAGTKVPVKRPRDSSPTAPPAPSPAAVPAPAVSPAVQAPLQQRAPVAPTPTPELHIEDDAGFSTQFVMRSFVSLTHPVCHSQCVLPQRKTCCCRVLNGAVGTESNVRDVRVPLLHPMTVCAFQSHTLPLSSPTTTKKKCKCTNSLFFFGFS